MVAPAVVVAFAIAVVPLVYGFWLSFQDWYMLRQPTPVFGGLINYVALFHDGGLVARGAPDLVWTIGTVSSRSRSPAARAAPQPRDGDGRAPRRR